MLMYLLYNFTTHTDPGGLSNGERNFMVAVNFFSVPYYARGLHMNKCQMHTESTFSSLLLPCQIGIANGKYT